MDKSDSGYQDIEVISPEDCGNAPKKRILKEFTVATAKNDIEYVTEFTSDKIVWHMVNEATVHGREDFFHVFKNKMTSKITRIEIQTIITHGKTAALNGTVTLEDDRVYSFCNVYQFVSAGKNKIKEITSYVIKMDK